MRNQTILPTDLGREWSPPTDEELAFRVKSRADDLVDRAAVIVSADWAKAEVNTGVMIFRNTNVTRRLVRAWWDVDDHAKEFDREQFAFREYIYKKEEWSKHIARLPVNAMNYYGWFVRHYATGRPRMRLREMTRRIVAAVIDAVQSENRRHQEFNNFLRLLQA
ncbi:hypothetical protein MHU86_1496 [Fragilaria crotonensis]|nr:hypothetical protein MHU86_1496 [Fragilaria crotonensis]